MSKPSPLRLRLAAGPGPDVDTDRPCTHAWKISGLHSTLVDDQDFLRHVTGVRVGADAQLVVEPLGSAATSVGHVVRGDRRPIPPVGHRTLPTAVSAFFLDRTAAARGDHLIVGGSALQQLRSRDGWFARHVPAFVGALCVPLAMAPLPAFASGSASRRGRRTDDAPEDVEVQQPTGGIPKPPTLPPDPVVEASPPPEVPPQPEIPPQPNPVAAPDPGPPLVQPEGQAVMLPDSAWEAMVGGTVELTVSDGREIVGELIVVDRIAASVADQSGEVVAVPLTTITRVRILEPAKKSGVGWAGDPPVQYQGMLVGGAVMVSIGGVVAVTGAAMLGLFAGTTYASPTYTGILAGTVLVPGLLVTAGGAAMLAIALKRRTKYKAQISFAPQLHRNNWGGALRVAF